MNFHGSLVVVLMVVMVFGLAAAASAQRTVAAPSDVAAPPDDAEVTASGLASKVVEAGSGTQNPGPTSTVTVHYTGWMTDGQMFDSSILRGTPATFPLDRVIKGWTEGLQMLKGGGMAKLTVPPHLAYGSRYRDKIPACSVLIFEIELFGITD